MYLYKQMYIFINKHTLYVYNLPTYPIIGILYKERAYKSPNDHFKRR